MAFLARMVSSSSSDRDYNEESINSNTYWSTLKDSNMDGGKIDEYFEVNSSSIAATSKDCALTSEDANVTDMRAEFSSRGPLNETSLRKMNSNSNKNWISICVGNDNDENLTTSKRKNLVVEKFSNVPATLVVDTSNPSKRLRWINGVDQRLSNLQRNSSSSIGSSNVIGYPKAFESSNWFHSKTNITRDVELVKKKISKKIKESEKRERQWRKLLHMQLEDKLNLEKEIETKEGDFVKGYKIELLLFQKFHVLTKEVLNDSNSKHHRRLAEMKRKHQVCLQDLETKQLEARQKFIFDI